MSDYMRGLRERVGTALVQVPAVAGLVFDSDGRILLARHSNGGVWVAPGGAIDPDESPQDAVVRELWEETGLHVEPIRLCGVFGGPECRVRYGNGDEVSFVISVFECRETGGELRADGEEVLEVGYFTTSEMTALDLAPWARLLLPRLARDRTGAWIPVVTWRPPAAR